MDTNPELLHRGVANIIPNIKLLEQRLNSGNKLNIYMGIDPTATRIHLGHAVTLRKIQQFAEMGHNVTFLVGDFTALIGDTSDKTSERPVLTSSQIQENLTTYKEQAKKILDFDKIAIKFNSQWLSKLTFEDILKLTMNFSVNDFISRELIKKRLTAGTSVGLAEVMYPLMQGYDSLHLNTDIQLGGTDQTFNMQAGRTLLKNLKNKESFIITNVFLTGTDGRKMSKTWDNAIWLDDKANDMYRKVMSIKDELIMEYFILATDIPLDEIKKIGKSLDANNPMDTKKMLAHTITKIYHGEQKAERAAKEFQNVVQDKKAPEDIPTISVADSSVSLASIAIMHNLVDSNSEWKRYVSSNSVSYNDMKISNAFINVSELREDGILKIGKQKFAKIKL